MGWKTNLESPSLTRARKPKPKHSEPVPVVFQAATLTTLKSRVCPKSGSSQLTKKMSEGFPISAMAVDNFRLFPPE